MNTKKIAVLISNAGKGTNLQAIIDAVEQHKINASISLVVSDSNDAYGLVRAKKHKLPVHVLLPGDSIVELLSKRHVIDYVVLSGWKKIIPDKLIEAFPNKILNIHPGLIPDTIADSVLNPDGTPGVWNRGKFTTKAIQNFLDIQATYAGSTVHFLTKEFDFGPVLGRCYEKVLPGDTVESLYTRLKLKENQLYIDALISVCE